MSIVPKSRKSLLAVALLGTGLGAVAGASSVEAVNDAYSSLPPSVEAGKKPPASTIRNSTGSLADMVEAVGPAVVQIEVRPDRPEFAGAMGVNPSVGQWSELFDDRPAAGQPARAALGSGFVIDPRGIVVTNNHVVANARDVIVKFNDGRELTGRVLGRDPKTDLAVVRIDGGGEFKAIPWGDSDGLRVGDGVFAVGSPFGLGNTVTSGIVSARGREIGAGPYDDFLQVDAAINTGNSGGPLFDGAGRVVGVNTAIFSPSGGNVGIGFAIPSRLAQSIVRQIVAEGRVSRGRIGVALQPLSPEIARELDLPDTRGALIADIEAGSPAEEAGLQRGDVVTSFAGREVKDSRELSRAVAQARIGTSVPAHVIRNGRTTEVRLRIVPMREAQG